MLRHAAPQRVLLVALKERRARHTLLLGVCLFLGEVRDAGLLLDLPGRSESHEQRLKGYQGCTKRCIKGVTKWSVLGNMLTSISKRL